MNHKQTHRQNGLAAANGEAVEEGRIVNFRVLWLVVQSLSFVSFVTPWTVAKQVLLSMEFPRQEYSSQFPCSLFILYIVKVKIAQSCLTLATPWTGVGSLSLLQGIFPTQGSNPGLLHCMQIFYQLSHKGSPRILEWVANPISSRLSLPGNQTGVS